MERTNLIQIIARAARLAAVAQRRIVRVRGVALTPEQQVEAFRAAVCECACPERES